MGVSFKVSKTGTRFRPKPVAQLENDGSEVSEDSKGSSLIGSKNESSTRKLEGDIAEGLDDLSGASSSFISDEVSFLLNLYPDGYSIGKPLENDTVQQADASKLLHPYDRTSETLFSAIESGRLPGDILDDIPCTYINGSLICEVRDYRKCAPDQGSSVPTANPVVNKVCLRMSLENVVKDIPLISDNSWTYGDLMEVESRILKALQPQLCLDPTPKLDRLSKDPVPVKLNLALSSLRRKRLRQLAEVTVTSNNRIHGKKVCIDRVPESSNSRFEDSGMISGNVMPQHVPDMTAQNIGPNNLVALRARNFVPDGNVQAALPLISPQSRYQMGVGTPRSIMDQGSGSLVNIQGASPAGQDMMISYGDNANSVASFHGKRENQDAQMSPLSSFNKRMRLGQLGSDGIQQQQIGPHMDNLHPTDINWKNSMLQKPAMARAIPNVGIQKYPQQMFEGVMNQNAGATSLSTGQSGMRFGPKEEQFENEKLDSAELSQGKNDMHMMQTETSQLELYQSRPLQQRLPQHLMRHNLPQEAWNNIGQDSRKEEQLQKRKSVQSPRLSTGALVQSPLSSKSGEFSSGSAGPHFGAVAATAAVGSSQKEKSAVTSGPAVGGNPSLTYSTNDSLQRQHQAQLAAKRRTNSLPKTTAMSGVASPASVSNISVPLNANSPSVGTPPMADQSMLERFSKIEMVTMRHQLNCKKNKVDNYPVRKPYAYSPQQLMTNLANNEDFKDDTSRELSKSLIGGSMNTCKMRTINFMLADRVLQGNVVSYVPRARGKMIMSQKPSDGTVAMQYVDVEDVDVLSAEDYLPTLPNSHFADLLAKQFFSLMVRDGYLMEDHIQPKPPRSTVASRSQPNAIGIPPNNSQVEAQQYNEVVPSQPSNEIKPTISGNASVNSSLNLLANSRMMPPGNPQSLQMSQGLLSGVSLPARPQQLDPQGPQPSLQQQQPQPQQQAQQQPQQQPPSQQQEQNQQMMMQQQHSPFQRSPMGLSSNPLSQLNAMGQNSNMQLGNHMVNKPSALQRQLLQQQQQQQIQPQQQQQLQPQQRQQQQLEQRKMMMALGTTMGVANIGNSMVGLGNLGNTMGIGGARGIGGLGISGPMTPMSGMSSVGQNQMNLGQTSNFTNTTSQQLRNVQMTPQQAAFLTSKIKMMQQSRTNMLGGSAARQMHPSAAGLSMLCQSINRTNMNPIQRSLGPMGPPKLMQANLYLNPQQQQQQQPQQQMQLQQQQQQQQQLQQLQQQQQQQQLQQLQQQQQPPQMQQQQQQETSLQQAVMSPSQVGSPSTMGILQLNQQSQQQPSPQKMSQRTPMSPQMSSGAIHAISAGNPEACPASPQLSSQTLGSVGSITNSPMELQGVNKSNSVGNA